MTSDAARVQSLATTGWWRGLGGLTAAEVRRWLPWRSLVLAAVGAGVLTAIFAIWWFAGSQDEINYRLGTLMYPFFVIWAIVMTMAVAAAAQGAVAGEVEEGTAAWLVGMPIGRPAFVLSKVLGAIPGVLVAVFLPGLAGYPILSYASGIPIEEFHAGHVMEAIGGGIATEGFAELPAMSEYLGMLVRISLFLLVLVALMVLLGTLLRSQGIVLGLGVLLAVGLFVLGLFDVPGLTDGTPAGLISGLIDAVRAEPALLSGPALVAVLWIVGLTLLAVFRFRWKEL